MFSYDDDSRCPRELDPSISFARYSVHSCESFVYPNMLRGAVYRPSIVESIDDTRALSL